LPRTFALTTDLVARHASAPVLCLAAAGYGRRWELYPERPGAERNTLVSAEGHGLLRAPLVQAQEPPPPAVMRVDIRGPIDEFAGAPGPCEDWIDGNDAICERLCAAFAEGDVLLCVHSPGGNPAGAPEGLRRALETKAANGRRCIVHSEGMVASLAFWWAACLADEMYGSPDSKWGSIGCRGAHSSVAGMLAKDGIAVTFSVWPDEGKAAAVAELPLSAIGKARNDRDVAMIGEAFAAAVASSPIGIRNGLTVDVIRQLPGSIGGADVLTGEAALRAGLIDGLATLEDTAAWALESAGTGPGDTMSVKAEGGGDKPPEKDPNEKPEGKQPSGVCTKCGMGQRPESKFCDQCGASMAAEPMPDDGDKDPDSSARPGAIAARRPIAAVRPQSPAALASIPALRTALSQTSGLLDRIAGALGAKAHAEIEGALEATCRDAANAVRYRTERNQERTRSDARERMDLLASLYTQDPSGHPRGKLVVDVVEDVGGKPTITGQRPAEQWGDGATGRTLANLRAYTKATLASLGPADANPYNRAPLEANQQAAQVRATGANAPAAKGAPAVRMAVRQGTNEDEAAAIFAREFGGVR
jgi:ClpP class serine protease